MSSNMKTALEIEKKYVIALPPLEKIREMDSFTKSDILQIYLKSEKGETHRIRRRTREERSVFTETRKVRVDEMSAVETEGEISEEDFSSLAKERLENTRPIEKSRYTFLYKSQLFEIDVYPEWAHTAILETELPSREALVEMPDFIKIIKDVTGDKRYSNAGMSREFPPECAY